MHCHTNEVSRCGQVPAAEQVRFYKRQGFDGIILTDHFLNANTHVDPEGQSWEETCDQLFAGYRAARAEGDRLGLKVFYGFEYGYDQTDLLVYGLGYDWLRAHPDVHKLGVHAFLELARADGAYIVHAHPYREASYIHTLRLYPRLIDGVEVLNIGNLPEENALAKIYAEHYGLTPVAGTDNHIAGRATTLAGMETPQPCHSIEDIIAAMKDGSARIFTHEVS